jgi:hypothetical protein
MQYVYQQSVKKDRRLESEQSHIQFIENKTLSEVIASEPPLQYKSAYFSDLQDKRAKEHLVFTDDQRYFYAPSVTDWHAYSVKLFKQKGWKVDQVYARNYWFDKDRFFDQLK